LSEIVHTLQQLTLAILVTPKQHRQIALRMVQRLLQYRDLRLQGFLPPETFLDGFLQGGHSGLDGRSATPDQERLP